MSANAIGGRRTASAPARRRNARVHRSAKTGAFETTGFMTHFIDPKGNVDFDVVVDALRLTKGQLADTVGLAAATISKADRRGGPRAQNRVREMLEILERVHDWAGSDTQALAWYRAEPIPALDGRTAEALVKSGEAAAVRDYLDHLALGGFA